MLVLYPSSAGDLTDVINELANSWQQKQVIQSIGAEDIAQLPFCQPIVQNMQDMIGALNEDIQAKFGKAFMAGCVVVYGDGSAAQMIEHTTPEGITLVFAVIDLRFAFEALAYISMSPSGSYSPSIEKATALELLAIVTRLAATANEETSHLVVGLASLAQDCIFTNWLELEAAQIEALVDQSFLTEKQVWLVIMAVMQFQLFHEYGHYCIDNSPDVRELLTENFEKYVRFQSENLTYRRSQDVENLILAREILGKKDAKLFLSSETASKEHARLLQDGLLARLDRDELLCDNFAVQNTAKVLVETMGLGTSDWITVRSVFEFVLSLSWSTESSREVFTIACEEWNRVATFGLEARKADAVEQSLRAALDRRRRLAVFQRFRLRYAVEQFDATMATLLHSALISGVEINEFIDRVFPSHAMGRVMQEFSARCVASVDNDIFTTEGLRRCSSRGRSLTMLLTPNARDSTAKYCDLFSFFVMGVGHHFDRAMSF